MVDSILGLPIIWPFSTSVSGMLDCLQSVNSHIRFKINPFGLQNPSGKRCKTKKLGENETKGEKNSTSRCNAILSCFLSRNVLLFHTGFTVLG